MAAASGVHLGKENPRALVQLGNLLVDHRVVRRDEHDRATREYEGEQGKQAWQPTYVRGSHNISLRDADEHDDR